MNEILNKLTASPLARAALFLAVAAGGVLIGMQLERQRLYAKFQAAADANRKPATESTSPGAAP